MTRTVLVTGARGKTGLEVVGQLRGRPDVEVLAGSSRPAGRADGNVRPVAFNWADDRTWSDAVAEADAIYLMRPDLPDAPERVGAVVALDPTRPVVLLSEQGAGELPPEHWASRVEEAVIGPAEQWTLLRPSWFSQVFTDPRFFLESIRDNGVVTMPTGDTPIAWVDARDIAAVAVQALLDPQTHRGVAHPVTGPTALSVQAFAGRIASAAGRPIATPDVDVDDVVSGVDPWTAWILRDLYARIEAGSFSTVSSAVEQVTGRPARTVEQFVDEHVEHWR